MWFTIYDGGNFNFGGIGRITTTGVTTTYPLPSNSPAGEPGYITAGSDGALWFAMGAGGYPAIGRITTSGDITVYPIPTLSILETELGGITAGPDGALCRRVHRSCSRPNHYGWNL